MPMGYGGHTRDVITSTLPQCESHKYQIPVQRNVHPVHIDNLDWTNNQDTNTIKDLFVFQINALYENRHDS